MNPETELEARVWKLFFDDTELFNDYGVNFLRPPLKAVAFAAKLVRDAQRIAGKPIWVMFVSSVDIGVWLSHTINGRRFTLASYEDQHFIYYGEGKNYWVVPATPENFIEKIEWVNSAECNQLPLPM